MLTGVGTEGGVGVGAGVRAGLEVLAAGPLCLVQDLGRPGWSHVGVTPSGAADRGALRLANRLLANPEGAAALEVTLGGLRVRALTALTAAATGAPCPLELNGRAVAGNAVLHLEPGSVLSFGTAAAGLRAYLAVRGGLAVPPVLGSRSTDVLSGLGPAPLRAGDVLPVGPAPARFPLLDHAPVPGPDAADSGDVVLRAVAGPAEHLLGESGLAALTATPWRVSPDSDRVGVRLLGPPLPLRGPASGRSEPAVRGSVQVPDSGRPLVFLADHPVTGGYPVAAVLLDAEADRAAQLRPGQRVRLRLTAPPRW